MSFLTVGETALLAELLDPDDIIDRLGVDSIWLINNAIESEEELELFQDELDRIRGVCDE